MVPQNCHIHVWSAKNKRRTHFRPLALVLYHEHDTGVRLVERVSVQQGLAGHAQLHLGHASSRTAYACHRGCCFLRVTHSDGEWRRGPAQRCVSMKMKSPRSLVHLYLWIASNFPPVRLLYSVTSLTQYEKNESVETISGWRNQSEVSIKTHEMWSWQHQQTDP